MEPNPLVQELRPCDGQQAEELGRSTEGRGEEVLQSLFNVGRPIKTTSPQPRKLLIEEISPSVEGLDFSKGEVTENVNIQKTVESKEDSGKVATECHGPSWDALQHLAEQAGSTIDREPLDINKDKIEFLKQKEQIPDNSLGELD